MGFVKTTVEQDLNEDNFFIPSSYGDDFVICKSPHKLKRLLTALQNCRQLQYVSDGDWSTHDLVMELLKQYQPAEIYITTYALRELPVRQLILAQDRKEIISVKMLLDYRAKVRTPEVFQLAEQNVNRIALTNIHAKVTIIKSEKGCVSIVGSANWTTNPRIECGVISLFKDVADFHIQWIEKVIDNAELFG